MKLGFKFIKSACVNCVYLLLMVLVVFVPLGVSQEGVLPPLKDLGIVDDEPAEIVLKGVDTFRLSPTAVTAPCRRDRRHDVRRKGFVRIVQTVQTRVQTVGKMRTNRTNREREKE